MKQNLAFMHKLVLCVHILTLFWFVYLGEFLFPETFTNSLEGLEIPRKSIDEVYDYILEDLDYCEAHLPIRGTNKYDVWRVSKEQLQALLSEVYLTLASMEGNNRILSEVRGQL